MHTLSQEYIGQIPLPGLALDNFNSSWSQLPVAAVVYSECYYLVVANSHRTDTDSAGILTTQNLREKQLV